MWFPLFPGEPLSIEAPAGRKSSLSESCVQLHSPSGVPTLSAHPPRFSPDDKYSAMRVALKKRFGLLPTQKPPIEF